MKTNLKQNLNTLQLSDVYSLMFFILYKVQDIPEYATVSELCYLLDGSNLTRLLTYFAGQTIKIPTESEISILANALLLYQYINVDGLSLTDAQEKLEDLTNKQKDEATKLYIKLIPVMNEYNISRSNFNKYERQG